MTTIGFGGFGAAPAAPGAATTAVKGFGAAPVGGFGAATPAAPAVGGFGVAPAAATPAADFGAAAPAPAAGGFGATTPAPAAFGAPSSLLGAPTTAAAAAAPDPSVEALAASRARLQALGLVTDAIRTSASLGSPLPDSTITKATAILKDPFNGLTLDIATVAAQRAASANNSTMGSVAADSSAVSPLTFQPFTEASQTGIALLTILMSSTQQQRQTSSSSYSDDVGALLASVAPSLVSSLMRFLMKAPSQLVAPVTVSSTSNGSNNNSNNLSAMQSQFLSPTAGGSTDYQNAMLAFKSSGSSNPLLLAAEALFLLTRHYQSTEQHLREVSALLDVLLDTALACSAARGPGVSLESFRTSESTQNMSSAVYLVTLSFSNMIASWSAVLPTTTTAVRGGGGVTVAPQPNQLLQTPTVAPFVEQWLRATVERLIGTVSSAEGRSAHGTPSSLLGNISGLFGGASGGGGGGARSSRPSVAAGGAAIAGHSTPLLGGMRGDRPHHQRSVLVSSPGMSPAAAAHSSALLHSAGSAAVLPLSFLPMIALALGAHYAEKQEVDKASDWIVAAALGKGFYAHGGSIEHSSGTTLSNLAFVTLGTGGKAFKRIVQLSPLESTLAMPFSSIVAVPLAMMAYMMDDALPALHWMAELDLKSYHQYLETQREEELAALQQHQEQQEQHRLGLRGHGYGAAGGAARNATNHIATNTTTLCSGFSHLATMVAWCIDRVPTAYWSRNFAAGSIDDAPNVEEEVGADGGEETAVTFFTFRNGCAHIRSAFELQRQDALWEPFAHKTMSSFLVLLAALCRHPPTANRVARLLSESQVDCTELHWTSLFAQAKECSGLGNGAPLSSANILDRLSSAAAPTSATAAAFAARGAAAARLNKYSTPQYAEKQQERFFVSTLGLFRAVVDAARISSSSYALVQGTSVSMLVGSGGEGGVVSSPNQAGSPTSLFASQSIHIETVLLYFQSNKLSAAGLGEVLLLLSALVLSASDAERVWEYLDAAGMLKVPSAYVPSSASHNNGSSTNNNRSTYSRFSTTAMNNNNNANSREPTSTSPLSLLGHAQREVYMGHYPIARGLLALLFNIFGVMTPSQQKHSSSIRGVVKFVAEEIAAGARRRSYVDEEESHVMLALSCAVLTQASNLKFSSDAVTTSTGPSSASVEQQQTQTLSSSTTSAILPLHLITASFKAPMDVLGDVLDVVATLSTSSMSRTLLPVEICVLRQALVFLKQVIVISREQGVASAFPLEARTVGNVDLVVSLLKLTASCEDPIVAQECITILSILSSSSHSVAARFLNTRMDVSVRLREAFSLLLDSQTVNQVALRIYAPLRTLSLRFEGQASVLGFEVRTKALFLDLLIQSALMPAPSLLSWLIGLHPFHRPLAPSSGSDGATTNSNNSGEDHICLEALVEGANDNTIASTQPILHLKYLRLLFLLKVHHNGLISNIPAAVTVLKARRSESYLAWVLHCGGEAGETSESIAQYGMCLKTLALEALRSTSSSSSHTTSSGASSSFKNSSWLAMKVIGALLSDARGVNAVGRQQAATYAANGTASMSLFPISRQQAAGTNHTTNTVAHHAGDAEDADDALTMSSLSPFREWPIHVMRSLEVFPGLPLPPGGLEQFIRTTSDNVPQYSIVDLYRTFLQLIQAEREYEERTLTRGGGGGGQTNAATGSAARPSIEEALKERLTPYVHANRCLVSYASAIQFVQGWTEVIEVASTLSSSSHHTDASSQHQQPAVSSSAVAEPSSATAVPSALRHAVIRSLTIDELLRYVQSALEAIDVTSNFTVAAQEQLASTLSRAVLTLVSKLATIVSEASKAASSHHQWNRTDVQRTLGALLNTLCLLGPRSAAMRSDLYNSLGIFLTLRDLPLDPILLFRAQAQLFGLILGDMNESEAPSLQLASINCLRTLLDVSPQLCDAFCSGQHGAGSCAPTLSQFVASATAVIDDIALAALQFDLGSDGHAIAGSNFQSSSSSNDNVIASYIVRGLLDILLIASVQHADAVHRSNAFLLCNRMRLWTSGTRQALDFVSRGGGGNVAANINDINAAAEYGALLLKQAPSYALLRQILVGVLRWYNCALRSLSEFQDAVVNLADIVNVSQLLLQLAVSPGAIRSVFQSTSTGSALNDLLGKPASTYYYTGATSGGSSSSPSAAAAASLITTVYEVSEILLNFSQTLLLSQCSELVATFAVPNLIRELLRGVNAFGASSSSFLSAKQQQSLCKSIRNLTLFVVAVNEWSNDQLNTQSPSAAVASTGMANHSIEVTPEVLVELLMATATVLREATAGHTTNPSAAAALQSTGRVLLVARGGTGTHSTAPHAAGATNSSVTLEGDGVSLQALSDTAQAIGLTLMRSIMTGPPRRGSTLQVNLTDASRTSLSTIADARRHIQQQTLATKSAHLRQSTATTTYADLTAEFQGRRHTTTDIDSNDDGRVVDVQQKSRMALLRSLSKAEVALTNLVALVSK